MDYNSFRKNTVVKACFQLGYIQIFSNENNVMKFTKSRHNLEIKLNDPVYSLRINHNRPKEFYSVFVSIYKNNASEFTKKENEEIESFDGMVEKIKNIIEN